MDLSVAGLGYVGLPLAREASRAGLSVVGVDCDPAIVDGLTAGRSHVGDVPDADLAAMLAAGFRATTSVDALGAADTVVICVPTPLSAEGGPDLAAIRSVGEALAPRVRPGMLVVLESTTYPGTTDDVLVPLLARSGLVPGVDLHVAFSPERIDPGNARYGVRNTPKVVGGHTPACTDRAVAFYGELVDTVVPARGTREAETAKLLENTYRHVNIALVNEMARFCHELGIDLWDVIRLAATKPFGFEAFYPGPGVGGHCIPIDPHYLGHNVRTRLGYPFRFVELAQEVNATMPGYVARRAQDALNDAGLAVNGATVLLLGVTYKPDVADQRQSPAIPLARRLAALGARVRFHDPHVARWTVDGEVHERVDDLDGALAGADLVVLLQCHGEYDRARIADTAARVLDTRGALPEAPSVQRL